MDDDDHKRSLNETHQPIKIQCGPKVSTHTLQMANCTYLFENSVTKIWEFDFLGPHQINIEVLILVFVNMLETPL